MKPPKGSTTELCGSTFLSARIFCTAIALATMFASVPVAQAPLPHLRGVAEIRDWFNAGKGHARLILLLSPT